VLNPTILALSGLVGITTTVILFCAHFHQVGFAVWLICGCVGVPPLLTHHACLLTQRKHRLTMPVPVCLTHACLQIEGDQKHGKMSPLVRLGTKKGTEVRGWEGVGTAASSLPEVDCKQAGRFFCLPPFNCCSEHSKTSQTASHVPGLPAPPPFTPRRPPQVLKFAVGFTHIVTLVLGLMGVLPFACWTSAMVAYGMAGEMVKLAETNSMSEWGAWAARAEHSGMGQDAVAGWEGGG
jgi:hypothetical protein